MITVQDEYSPLVTYPHNFTLTVGRWLSTWLIRWLVQSYVWLVTCFNSVIIHVLNLTLCSTSIKVKIESKSGRECHVSWNEWFPLSLWPHSGVGLYSNLQWIVKIRICTHKVSLIEFLDPLPMDKKGGGSKSLPHFSQFFHLSLFSPLFSSFVLSFSLPSFSFFTSKWMATKSEWKVSCLTKLQAAVCYFNTICIYICQHSWRYWWAWNHLFSFLFYFFGYFLLVSGIEFTLWEPPFIQFRTA